MIFLVEVREDEDGASRGRGNKEELLRKPVSQQIQSNLAAQVGDQWIKMLRGLRVVVVGGGDGAAFERQAKLMRKTSLSVYLVRAADHLATYYATTYYFIRHSL